MAPAIAGPTLSTIEENPDPPRFHMPLPQKTLAELAVDIALEEVRKGVFETNNDNRGERIDEYQKSANGVMAEAWCAKFVFWCFEQASARRYTKNPMPKIFAARAFELWATRERKIVEVPELGDVLILEHRHVGIVAGAPTSTGTIPSVEGNTWARSTFQNRREGVYALQKQKISKCTFARLV
ncbi:MAG: CHAP domain-containing protein [Deltaproteobacteria bacterium]|nr:CHAP domain-containing protein [Deltaproteobacteria bacterium]